MSVQLGNFNAGTMKPAGESGYTPVPAGVYKVMIVSSEQKKTKKAEQRLTGHENDCYILLKYKVLDGPHAGTEIEDRLNFINQTAIAQEIGQRQLADVCRAVNVFQPSDTGQLHGKPLAIKVKVKSYPGQDGQQKMGNEVVLRQSLEEAGASLGPAGQAAQTAPAPAQSQATQQYQQPVAAATADPSAPPWQ